MNNARQKMNCKSGLTCGLAVVVWLLNTWGISFSDRTASQKAAAAEMSTARLHRPIDWREVFSPFMPQVLGDAVDQWQAAHQAKPRDAAEGRVLTVEGCDEASQDRMSQSLRRQLENYLEKNRDFVPPKVERELRAILGLEDPRARQHIATSTNGSWGRLVEPIGGQRLATSVPVIVTTGSIPPNSHLWLAVECGGRVWPKESEVRQGVQGGTTVIFEGGSSGELSLSLLLVSQEGHGRIVEWLKRGHETGHYPGLLAEQIDATRLDTVHNLKR